MPIPFHIKVIEEGNQKTYPKVGHYVACHYTGYLKGNTLKKFDSSLDRGKPFLFQVGVGQVIKGWDQSIMKMSEGERAQVTVRPEYAYGERGVPGVIPPNATLVFVIDLLKVFTK